MKVFRNFSVTWLGFSQDAGTQCAISFEVFLKRCVGGLKKPSQKRTELRKSYEKVTKLYKKPFMSYEKLRFQNEKPRRVTKNLDDQAQKIHKSVEIHTNTVRITSSTNACIRFMQAKRKFSKKP